MEFSSLDKDIIRKLQTDLPLVPEPYKLIADELGITEQALLSRIQEFYAKGILRRIGTVLYHQQVGFKYNAMVVWIIPKDRIEDVGKVMVSFPQVTHCYERSTSLHWPYNMFTMTHGETKEECEAVAAKISELIVIKDYKLLYSTKELKKTSMKYFLEAENKDYSKV